MNLRVIKSLATPSCSLVFAPAMGISTSSNFGRVETSNEHSTSPSSSQHPPPRTHLSTINHHLISTIIISITHHRGVYKVYSSPFIIIIIIIIIMPLQIYLQQHDIMVDLLSSIGSGRKQIGHSPIQLPSGCVNNLYHASLPAFCYTHSCAAPYAIPDIHRYNISRDRNHHLTSSFQYDVINSGDAAGSAIHHVECVSHIVASLSVCIA